MKTLQFLVLLLIFGNCKTVPPATSVAENKAAIIKTEHEFAELLAAKGIAEAFYTYAAPDAILNRDDSLYTGPLSIKTYYENWPYKNVKLQWKPDFVEVAASGELGYTYGKYTFSAINQAGKEVKSKGVFHTVWKKQPDGKWRFVWD